MSRLAKRCINKRAIKVCLNLYSFLFSYIINSRPSIHVFYVIKLQEWKAQRKFPFGTTLCLYLCDLLLDRLYVCSQFFPARLNSQKCEICYKWKCVFSSQKGGEINKSVCIKLVNIVRSLTTIRNFDYAVDMITGLYIQAYKSFCYMLLKQMNKYNDVFTYFA